MTEVQIVGTRHLTAQVIAPRFHATELMSPAPLSSPFDCAYGCPQPAQPQSRGTRFLTTRACVRVLRGKRFNLGRVISRKPTALTHL